MKNKRYPKMVSILALVLVFATSLWFSLPATHCYAQGGYGGGGEPEEIEVVSHPGFSPLTGTLDVSGVLTDEVTAKSPDKLCQLTLNEGTKALDKLGDPLSGIIIVETKEPPAPPADANIVGLTYDLGPDGAIFDPPITLTFTYDPDEIPEGVNEEDLVIAKTASKWVELEDCTVDPVTHTISAPVSHFSKYAVLTPLPPPPAPAAFSVSNLSVQPAEVQPKAAVTISLSVANTGGTEGSYTVVLKINDLKDRQKIAYIAGGDSKIVTFSVTREEIGSYSVAVDNLSARFTVVSPAPPEKEEVVPPEKEEVVPPEKEEVVPELPAPAPIAWWVWLIVGIVAVAVIGAIVWLVIRRRGA